MFKAKVEKKGRKWFQVFVEGKKGSYPAKALINEISKSWNVGDEVEFDAESIDKSTIYGKNYELIPKVPATPDEIAQKIQERKNTEAKKWFGYIENTFKTNGYMYKNGIEKLKELGFYEKYESEIKEMTMTVEQNKAAKRAALEEAKRLANEGTVNFAFEDRFERGTTFIENNKAYRVLSCSYQDCDGFSFGVMSEEWYSIKAVDISETPEGQEIINKNKKLKIEETAKREKAAQKNAIIKEICDYIKEYGERPDDAGSVSGEPLIDTFNIYGGGYQLVICYNEIWYIKNNGMDGDDWSLNNVRTGGAGAIGWIAPLNDNIRSLIAKLREF